MTAADRYRAACAALGLPVWRPGMLAVRAHGRLSTRVVGHDVDDAEGMDRSGAEPDFADPATVGCLLAAAREAWDDDGTYARPAYQPVEGNRWLLVPGDGGYAHGWGDTEAAALIAALEAAAARRGGQP
jgi:hypothetical protein